MRLYKKLIFLHLVLFQRVRWSNSERKKGKIPVYSVCSRPWDGCIRFCLSYQHKCLCLPVSIPSPVSWSKGKWLILLFLLLFLEVKWIKIFVPFIHSFIYSLIHSISDEVDKTTVKCHHTQIIKGFYFLLFQLWPLKKRFLNIKLKKKLKIWKHVEI